jgi:hypothetical protein
MGIRKEVVALGQHREGPQLECLSSLSPQESVGDRHETDYRSVENQAG